MEKTTNPREAFLNRSEPLSATRVMDEAVLAQFDNAGLGNHPDFLAMLEVLVSDDPSTNFRAVKARAYRLLNKVTAESEQKRMEQMEVAAGQQAAAKRFYDELIDATETFTDIAEQHGARTLSDLMYLQNAILSGGYIDHYPNESAVLDIVRALPSGEEWVKYIKVECAPAPAQ